MGRAAPGRHMQMKEENYRLTQTILKGRRDGKSFPQLSQELGMAVPTIHRKFKKAMQEIITPDVIELRKLETMRLNEYHRILQEIMTSVHPLINQGQQVFLPMLNDDNRPVLDDEGQPVMVPARDVAPVLAAIDKGLKAMERHAKIWGIDTPTKVAMTTPDGNDEATVVQFYIPSNGREIIEG